MITAQRWNNRAAKIANIRTPSKPDFFVRLARDLVSAGFCLANPAMTEAYFALIGAVDEKEIAEVEADGEKLGKDELVDFSLWLRRVSDEGYCQNLCKVHELSPGWYVYATHSRSEDIFDAVSRMEDVFSVLQEQNGPDCLAWVMPILDDEEGVSFNFEILTGTAEEVLERIRANKPVKPVQA